MLQIIAKDRSIPSTSSPPIEVLPLANTAADPDEYLLQSQTWEMLTRFVVQKQEHSLRREKNVLCGRIYDSGVLPM